MTSKTLTEYLEAKNAMPSSVNNDTLAILLKSAGKKVVAGQLAAAPAAVVERYIATQPMRIAKVSAKVEVCGTAAGPTTIMPKIVRRGDAVGAAIDVLAAAISVAHDAADGVNVDVTDAEDFDADEARNLMPGDMLVLDVTAVATNATGIAVSVELEPLIEV